MIKQKYFLFCILNLFFLLNKVIHGHTFQKELLYAWIFDEKNLKNPSFITPLMENYKLTTTNEKDKIFILKFLAHFLKEDQVFNFFIDILNYPDQSENNFDFSLETEAIKLLHLHWFKRHSNNPMEDFDIIFLLSKKYESFSTLEICLFKLLNEISISLYKKNGDLFFIKKLEYQIFNSLLKLNWKKLDNEWIIFEYVELYSNNKYFVNKPMFYNILNDKKNSNKISPLLEKTIQKLLNDSIINEH